MTSKSIETRNFGSALIADTIIGNVEVNTRIYGNCNAETEPKSICFRVIVPDNDFVGRVDELRRLRDAISTNRTTQKSSIIIISGLGGIGKTQLVRKFVNLNRASYKNLIWINAKKLEEEIKTLAVEMHILTDCQQNRDFDSIVQEVFNKLSATPTLMIFDNADKVENCRFVFTIATPGDKPDVIITSRIREWSTSICNIKLRVFNAEDAVEYVSITLTDPENTYNDSLEDKKKLVKKLQYFPLALRQATAHINDQRLSRIFRIDDYINNYNVRSKALLDSKIFQTDAFNTYEKTTFTTWKMSIDAIDQHKEFGDLAIRILFIMAFLDPDHIIRDIFFHLSGPEITDVDENVISAVKVLVNYSMVDSQQNQSVLNIHRLVQQVIRIELTSVDGMTEQILRDSLKLLSKTELKEIHGHATSVFRSALSFDDLLCEFKNFLTSILSSLIDCGKYSMTLNFGNKILPSLTRALGEDDEDTLSSMSLVARSHREMGKDSEAIKMFQRVVEKRTLLLGENHPDTLSAESGIAFSYRDQGRHSEALEKFESVFEKRKKTLGVRHPDTLVSKCNIAQSYRSLGKYNESYDMSKEVLEEQTEVLGEDHPNTLITQTNIARSYRDLKKHSEALKLFEEVYEKQKRILGKNHPNTLVTENNIARSYLNLNKYPEALEMFQKILGKRKQILGEKHPNTVLCKSKIANTYLSMGRNSDALKLFEEVFQDRRDVLGDNHVDTISTKSNIARTHSNLKNYSEALRLFEEVFEKRREISGENHPVTITYMSYIEETKKSINKSQKCVIH